MSERVSIRTMRRWGIGWRRIALCVLGFHARTRFNLDPETGRLRCARCGASLEAPRPAGGPKEEGNA